MQVRRALLSDAAAIAAVHVRSWQAAYAGLLPNGYLDGLDPADRITGWQQIIAAADLPANATFVAASGSDIVGFVSVCPSRDSDQNSRSAGEVASIYLTKESWGQGTGRALMSTALSSLVEAGCDAAYLWVMAANHRARAFYEAGGWHVDGALKSEELADVVLDEVRYYRTLANGIAEPERGGSSRSWPPASGSSRSH